MTADPKDEPTHLDGVVPTADGDGSRGENGSRISQLPRRSLIIGGLVVVALVGWFFFAWLGLHRDVVDAVGESVGSALLLLVLLSVRAAVTRHRAERAAGSDPAGRE